MSALDHLLSRTRPFFEIKHTPVPHDYSKGAFVSTRSLVGMNDFPASPSRFGDTKHTLHNVTVHFVGAARDAEGLWSFHLHESAIDASASAFIERFGTAKQRTSDGMVFDVTFTDKPENQLVYEFCCVIADERHVESFVLIERLTTGTTRRYRVFTESMRPDAYQTIFNRSFPQLAVFLKLTRLTDASALVRDFETTQQWTLNEVPSSVWEAVAAV